MSLPDPLGGLVGYIIATAKGNKPTRRSPGTGGKGGEGGEGQEMTRGPLSFKETDLIRAIKCAIKAGLRVAGYEITKAGSIVVHVGKPTEETTQNEWDVK